MKPLIIAIAVVLIAVSLIGLIVVSLIKKKKRISGGTATARTDAPVHYAHTVRMDAHYDHTVRMEDGISDSPDEMCRLRYLGTGEWPNSIYVSIGMYESFSIGRFDVVLGRADSSYEFPADSQAVSRHHALIFRDGDGYIIQDQESKGGTFVNGMKLEPGALYRLKTGYHISFGTAGADYIWEESVVPAANM